MVLRPPGLRCGAFVFCESGYGLMIMLAVSSGMGAALRCALFGCDAHEAGIFDTPFDAHLLAREPAACV